MKDFSKYPKRVKQIIDRILFVTIIYFIYNFYFILLKPSNYRKSLSEKNIKAFKSTFPVH